VNVVAEMGSLQVTPRHASQITQEKSGLNDLRDVFSDSRDNILTSLFSQAGLSFRQKTNIEKREDNFFLSFFFFFFFFFWFSSQTSMTRGDCQDCGEE
jgi:hypothetical protein